MAIVIKVLTILLSVIGTEEIAVILHAYHHRIPVVIMGMTASPAQ